jgi:hypothetical protein
VITEGYHEQVIDIPGTVVNEHLLIGQSFYCNHQYRYPDVSKRKDELSHTYHCLLELKLTINTLREILYSTFLILRA